MYAGLEGPGTQAGWKFRRGSKGGLTQADPAGLRGAEPLGTAGSGFDAEGSVFGYAARAFSRFTASLALAP